MSDGAANPTTMAEEFGARSRTRFVGRTAEIERFRAMLADRKSCIVWVFGPGGIGKSALLDVFGAVATEYGRRTVSVDVRSSTQPWVTLRTTVRAYQGETTGVGPPVIFIDSLERAESPERWLSEEVVVGFPPGSIIVVAGRFPPGDRWRTDPVLAVGLHLMPLRSLSAAEAGEFLERLEVDRRIRGAGGLL